MTKKRVATVYPGNLDWHPTDIAEQYLKIIEIEHENNIIIMSGRGIRGL
jgi:hypothetical protein